MKDRVHRYSQSRRKEAAWILDICASSRRDPFKWETGLKLFSGLVGPDDAQWLVHAHWRSFELATIAFYCTFYAGLRYHREGGLESFAYECCESAQRLREGWPIVDNLEDGHPNHWWW